MMTTWLLRSRYELLFVEVLDNGIIDSMRPKSHSCFIGEKFHKLLKWWMKWRKEPEAEIFVNRSFTC